MCEKLSPEGDSPDRWSRLTDKLEEYRAKIEQLETDKAFYHDKWLNALEQLAAAEQEIARLREGIESLESWNHRLQWVEDQDKFLAELAALLAKPEEKQ